MAQSGEYADYGTPWDEAAAADRDRGRAARADAGHRRRRQGQIAQAAAEHPEFEGRSAAVITPYEGLFVYGPEDPRSRMLIDLGFAFPEILAGDDERVRRLASARSGPPTSTRSTSRSGSIWRPTRR